MRRRVFLHGSLNEIHPGPITVVADTIAEAIKKISKQLPGFRPTAKLGYRRIKVVGHETLEALMSPGEEDIHIVPQFSGGKNGGLFEVLIGAALVAASFFLPASLAVLGPMMANVGLVLAIGGLLSMMRTPPEVNRSHYLGTPQNTTAIGTPIPILYGRRLGGGQFLSINVETVWV